MILMNKDKQLFELFASARRLRERTGRGLDLPLVIVNTTMLREGEEIVVADNVYVIYPKSFEQLDRLLTWLIRHSSTTEP